MVHDSEGGGQHNVAELTGRKHVHNPLLHVLQRHIKARRDDSALVDTSNKLHNNLSVTVIVEHGEISDVSILLHGLKKLDDNLGARAKENLSLSTLLSVTDRL